ncbi:MAG TPA: PP2C family protein-serine/threonine phosphatase, partial [Trebonia sp.]
MRTHLSRAGAALLAPLLAVPPALAGIGAVTVRRPLVYGAVSLLAAVAVALKPTEYARALPVATIFTIVVITAAAAEAKVGGDLYEVAGTEYGIRVIMGDVQGKGLGAIELAADVLGMFRELAHDASTLGELAARLDTGLGRNLGRHEEFVTALLLEIDPESGRTSVFNCGHPPPLVIAACGPAAARVTPAEVLLPAPPLGLLALGDCTGAQLTLDLQPNEQILLYTDGVTEARDRRRAFYPLSDRIGPLAARAALPAAGKGALKAVPGGAVRRGLLALVHADLLKHVGAPLNDDAALLLVGAP